MRLTLRTLLAWLDDKLPPNEVRDIGKQVSESPYAKDLVERIHRVTRQRRLTIPPPSGPGAVDPNIVAAYIDNELEAERVADFERKCLTSDVHLAEVSSTHQVLSLIGQKAKVPAEARLRMYGLIKGRESIRPTREEVERAAEPEDALAPQPWLAPDAPRRAWVDRFGPAVAVLGLIGVLALSAWKSLSPREEPRNVPTAAALKDAPDGAAAAREALRGGPPVPASPAPDAPVAAGPALVAAPPPAEVPTPATEPPPTPEAPRPSTPPGASGLAMKPKGVLLKFLKDDRQWSRLTEATPLAEQDRLLNLAPFRSSVELGTASVDLAGETEISVEPTTETTAARLALARGRLVLHGTAPSLPFEVKVGPTTFTIAPPPGANVGVERVNRRASGDPSAAAPALRVYVVEAPVTVTVGEVEKTIEEPGSALIGPGPDDFEATSGPPPAWLEEATPSSFEEAVGGQFLELLRTDRPIVSSLVEATESDQKDICRLAIAALNAVGDISYVIPLLNKQGDAVAATARRTAIRVLRDHLAEGDEAAATLGEQLKRDLGDEFGARAEELLIGYGAEAAENEETYARLVDLLGTGPETPVGLRELALENLRELTGRDDQGYDPEKPDAQNLKIWRDQLREHDLKPMPRKPVAN